MAFIFKAQHFFYIIYCVLRIYMKVWTFWKNSRLDSFIISEIIHSEKLVT